MKELVLFLLHGLSAMAVGVIVGWHYHERCAARRRKMEAEKKAQKLDQLKHRHLVAGMHLGATAWGQYVSDLTGTDTYGFAMDCEHCSATTSLLIHKRQEYWRCRKCGRRQPTPNPQPEEAHGHAP
ncbi:ribosomal protein S6E (S10) [Haloferula luteola]|uniref:Ribosomal protein S6E (S10) n=1 Tax=Haloferula luteola TaxID=595692 RepID=A0A840VB87_9BACT|nr:hypothetical protein [Haloferula luteola]MBB5351069.1 ribosomal protein S6E (S10) [Haloferula luteola]